MKLTESGFYWDFVNDQLNTLALDNDRDRELLVNYEVYRIVKVEQAAAGDPYAWNITIDRPYPEASATNLKHAVGRSIRGRTLGSCHPDRAGISTESQRQAANLSFGLRTMESESDYLPLQQPGSRYDTPGSASGEANYGAQQAPASAYALQQSQKSGGGRTGAAQATKTYILPDPETRLSGHTSRVPRVSTLPLYEKDKVRYDQILQQNISNCYLAATSRRWQTRGWS